MGSVKGPGVLRMLSTCFHLLASSRPALADEALLARAVVAMLWMVSIGDSQKQRERWYEAPTSMVVPSRYLMRRPRGSC